MTRRAPVVRVRVSLFLHRVTIEVSAFGETAIAMVPDTEGMVFPWLAFEYAYREACAHVAERLGLRP